MEEGLVLSGKDPEHYLKVIFEQFLSTLWGGEMRMRKKLAVVAVLAVVGTAAGCGTEQADSKQNVQTETDK